MITERKIKAVYEPDEGKFVKADHEDAEFIWADVHMNMSTPSGQEYQTGVTTQGKVNVRGDIGTPSKFVIDGKEWRVNRKADFGDRVSFSIGLVV